MKPSPIAEVPTSPRQKWPSGCAVSRPWRRLCAAISQAKITGIAKNERKKTASPGGTCGADDLMQIAIAVKTITEKIFRPMPRSGFMQGLVAR